MFDMTTNAGRDSGYQLRITYDSTDGLYTLSGYIVHPSRIGFKYVRDGASLHFDSLEEVLKYITDYQPGQGEQ